MNNNKPLAAGLALLMLLGLLTACSNEKQQKSTTDKAGPLVKTVQLGQRSGGTTMQFPGRVVANKRVDLAFQVSGPITQLPVRKGQITKKGELLASLDPRDFANDVKARQADFNKARRDLARAAELLRSGTIAQATYDNAKAAYENADAQLQIVKKALDDTKLLAPYDGLIANRFVENFQDIQAKQKIFSYQDIDHIDIEVDIPERDLVSTKPIRQRERKHREFNNALVFDAVPNRTFTVKVKEFVTEADPVTQTFRVVLTMPAPKEINILPGMSATLSVNLDQTDKVYKLPLEAVATNASGQRYVWLVNDDLIAKKQMVTVGDTFDQRIAVTNGLKSGDRVIVAGLPFLQEGMKVRLYVPKSEANRQ